MARNKLLIFVLGLLLVLRFVLVPWLDWQDEQATKLRTLTKQLVRSEALLEAREDVLKQSGNASQRAEVLKSGLIKTTDAAQYRIEFQQELQKKLDSMNVQLASFEWMSDQDLRVFSIQRGRINLRLQGKLADIVLAHGMLELDYPGLQIRDLRAIWQGPLNVYSVVELQMLSELDYLVQKP
ncbi:MAG: hypothetical protein KKE30_18560 [Gammaproteobacteria bacterium]|jgi:hypothetical protein|nr:hypothetical protein [Gammaproteobacteria bacterium]